MFTELGMLTCKLGNNWQLGDDRAIRAKMNTLTNATMEALLAAQEKVTVKKRHTTGPGATAGMPIMARIEATISKLKQLRNKRMHLKLMSSGPSGGRGKRVKANSRIGKRQARLKTRLKWLINSKFYSNTRQTTHNSASPDIESEKLSFKWQLAKNKKENSGLPGTQNQHIINSGQSNKHKGYEMDQQQINEMAERLFPEGQLGKCLHEIAETVENNRTSKEQRSGGTASHKVTISEGEIKEAIKKHRNKKYTGPDGLKFAIFNYAVKFIYNTLAIVARMSYHTSTVPDFCRLNQGTLIPKKEKGKFRIVHICSPITEFLETIALHRLEHLLDDRGLIDEAQFGFTANRSRIDLIACLINCIFKYDAYSGKNQQHSIIALDISGAFDNVANTHLIGKLNRDLDGETLVKWLANFTTNRKMRIKLGKTCSAIRHIKQGVPQGSALGPILWNFAIEDIRQELADELNNEQIDVLCYAYDITIILHADTGVLGQKTLDKLSRLLRKKQLEIDPSKTEQLDINSTGAEYNLNGVTVKKVNIINLLGVGIRDQLRLCTRTRDNDKLFETMYTSINRLAMLRRCNVITNKKQYLVLINATIKNIIIDNNLPVLAIEKTARKWAETQLCRALKAINGLLTNVSSISLKQCMATHRLRT